MTIWPGESDAYLTCCLQMMNCYIGDMTTHSILSLHYNSRHQIHSSAFIFTHSSYFPINYGVTFTCLNISVLDMLHVILQTLIIPVLIQSQHCPPLVQLNLEHYTYCLHRPVYDCMGAVCFKCAVRICAKSCIYTF